MKTLQAEVLYMDAQTWYDDFVVDVERQFVGKPDEAAAFFESFYNARQKAILDVIINEDFQIYCTTWGNSKDQDFPISSIVPFVDSYMPQTYVEIWGQSYIENPTC